MSSSPHGISRVPCAPISRLLEAFLIRRDGEVTRPAVWKLAEQIEYDPRNLYSRVLKGKSQTLDLYLADRILCAIDAVDAWHTEPELSRLYNLCLAA